MCQGGSEGWMQDAILRAGCCGLARAGSRSHLSHGGIKVHYVASWRFVPPQAYSFVWSSREITSALKYYADKVLTPNAISRSSWGAELGQAIRPKCGTSKHPR
ncbi:hypothetical protein BDN72DRAFT_135393 [Pluteus cervinus]|uniref:Uncharacterized protein n=1 Tax=Pluteus cervinus TaxID=181527 RepID=A0ACD3B858_9AGAR|nr:hypothetical protein BDN72DRAFT_135393 [Pluteus cervinus]